EIANFHGNGIVVQSSNDTIGGVGAGNTIHSNTGAAVDVTSGTGNAIRQNLIFANGSAIVSPNQTAPSISAVASVFNLTTIDYSVTGTASGTNNMYTVEFFASTGLGSPAAEFLGSAMVSVSGTATQKFTLMLTTRTTSFNIGTGLGNTQTVTATVTGPGNSTSVFATATAAPRTATSPAPTAFDVTNNSDNVQGSWVGSLRLSILDANNSQPASGSTDDITFSAPFVISPTAALPTIA